MVGGHSGRINTKDIVSNRILHVMLFAGNTFYSMSVLPMQ